MKIRARPCSSCPYRTDVPPGIWAPGEYEKILVFDLPTVSQPQSVFVCHSDPEKACSGWATCHENRGHENELLALRLLALRPSRAAELPEHDVKVFPSAKVAALHGLSGVEDPPPEAVVAMAKVTRLHARKKVREILS